MTQQARRYQLIVPAVLFAVCVVLWLVVFPAEIRPSDAVYPRIALAALTLLSVLLLAAAFRPTSKDEPVPDIPRGAVLLQLLVVAILLAVYTTTTFHVGFYLGSALFMPAMMLALGVRDWRILALAPGILIALVYGFMEHIMNSPLPRTRLF